MANYIWIDKSGNVIKTEPKGRGRPKAGSIPQPNGDSHIYVDSIPNTESKSPIITPVSNEQIPVNNEQINNEEKTNPVSTTESETEDKEINTNNALVINNETPIPVTDLINCIYTGNNKKNITQIDDGYQVMLPYMIKDPRIKGLYFNAAYPKMIISTKDKSILIFNNIKSNVAVKVIANAIV